MSFCICDEDNYILFYKYNFQLDKEIIIFNLDNTLITTQSGCLLPKDIHDYKYMENVVYTINNNNCLNFIITEQHDLVKDNCEDPTLITIKDYTKKIKLICDELDISIVFISLKNDKFKKPYNYSWLLLKNKFNFNDNKVKFYVSNYDDENNFELKYALNNNFTFKTGAEYFLNLNDISLNNNINYPILKYYTHRKFNTKINKLSKLIANYFENDIKFIILMIGFPSCGKSFLRNYLMSKFLFINYYNDFDIKNKSLNDGLLRYNEKYSYSIDDNYNLSKEDRDNKNINFTNYKKIYIYFNYDENTLKYLNCLRNINDNSFVKENINNKLLKTIDLPTEEEYNNIIKFNKILPFFKNENKYLF